MAPRPLHLLLALAPLVAIEALPPLRLPVAWAQDAAAPAAAPEAGWAPAAGPPPALRPEVPEARAPLTPPPEVRISQPARRFDESLGDLERQRESSPGKGVMRFHNMMPSSDSAAATEEACRSGAIPENQCASRQIQRRGDLGGQVVDPIHPGRMDGNGASNAGDGFHTDASPLPPISVPVSALLAGPGGSFRLTDVFKVTPRPAAIAGNGDRGLLFPILGSAVPTSGFGYRLHPVLGSWLMHAGRDLAAPEGTPVVAALSGRVLSSGVAGGYGLAIEIEHERPRRRTLYGHLSELYVKPGERVRQGEVIGRVGSTGLSTGPHLHFELRVPQDGGWVAVDPGEFDPGSGLAIAGLPGLAGLSGANGQPPDAVSLLMSQLLESLERPIPTTKRTKGT